MPPTDRPRRCRSGPPGRPCRSRATSHRPTNRRGLPGPVRDQGRCGTAAAPPQDHCPAPPPDVLPTSPAHCRTVSGPVPGPWRAFMHRGPPRNRHLAPGRAPAAPPPLGRTPGTHPRTRWTCPLPGAVPRWCNRDLQGHPRGPARRSASASRQAPGRRNGTNAHDQRLPRSRRLRIGPLPGILRPLLRRPPPRPTADRHRPSAQSAGPGAGPGRRPVRGRARQPGPGHPASAAGRAVRRADPESAQPGRRRPRLAGVGDRRALRSRPAHPRGGTGAHLAVADPGRQARPAGRARPGAGEWRRLHRPRARPQRARGQP